MISERLHKKASITKDGAVLIGKYLACDGADFDRPISIFSHAHGDHIGAFQTALSVCSSVIVTKETKDLLVAEMGSYLLRRANLIDLPFGTPFEYEDNKITLHPATHMLGSCQVLLVNGDQDKIVYTGDFAYPNTSVIKADVLVMEATYGKPGIDRTIGQRELTKKLVDITKEGIDEQRPIRIIAHPGKIQCLMNRLTSASVNVPFLAQQKDVKWAEVYRQHNLDVGKIYENRSAEAMEIRKSGQPHISFQRFGGTLPQFNNYVTIRASGFGAKDEIYTPRRDYYVIALSDHADFAGLIEYVEKSEAKLVITDWSRCEMADVLAKYIVKKLGVEAVALPLQL